MACYSDVCLKSSSALDELKVQIKQWESKFLLKNSRKPNKKDIDDAPDNMKGIYRQYWKARNVADQSSLSGDLPSESDAWSFALNKSNFSKQKKIPAGHSGLEYFSKKLKHEALVARPVVKEIYSMHSLRRRKVDGNNVLFGNEVSSQSNQNNAPLPVDKNSSEESGQKNVDAPKSTDILFKKCLSVTKSYENSQNLKNINILSSPLIDMSCKKRNIQMNVNPDWLESCTVVNDHKVSQAQDPMVSEVGLADKVTELALSNSEVEKGGNAGVSIFINTAVKRDALELKNSNSFGNSTGRSRTSFADLECRISSVAEIYHKSSDDDNVKPTDTLANSDHSHITGNASITQYENIIPMATGIPKNYAKEENNYENNEVLSSTDKHSVKRKFCDTTSYEDKLLEGHNTLKSDGANHVTKKSLKKSSGSVSDNYIRINLKKKVFVRGHHRINVRRMKFQKWKEHKKNSRSSVKTHSVCFKCGKSGHWARSCSAFKGKISSVAAKGKEITADCVNSEIGDEVTLMSNQYFPANQAILPLYGTTSGGKTQDTPNEVFKGLKKMGYSDFRPGQEKAIMRILSGMSTLFVSATGSGKSLCYQLPAYMYAQKNNCITLVVSPLVSLMEDQVSGLPSCLHAVCLHSGMSDTQKEAAVTAIMRGTAQILLISPEAVISRKLSGSISFSKLPPIAFVCIDEAHCLSEWSHNFRPSYLQLLKVLTDKMNVKCVLGLTATATRSIVRNIAGHLQLKDIDESIIGETNVPHNLLLTISRDKDKDWALIQLLKEERFHNCNSILIYCNRREETERLAMLIRTSLQQETCEPPHDTHKEKFQRTKKKTEKQLLWSAEAYHAGLRPQKRKSIQKNFMAGKLHVVVATIAFGMGLDKADVRAVIHYNMPKSFENYVQEIGRAGRDGLQAQCHVFLDSEGRDLWELRRHVYSNSVDRRTIRKLLQKIFMPCKCCEKKKTQSQGEVLPADNSHSTHQNTQTCMKHERAFSIAETVEELDLKEESITTLLCYLELHSNKWVEVLSPTYATCSVRCYGGPQQMKSLMHKCPVIAVAMALDEQCGKRWNGSAEYQFNVVSVASHMSWESSSIKKSLKQLEWIETNGKSQKTGVIIEFSDLAFHLQACGDLESDELDAVLDFLCDRVKTQEEQELWRLNNVFSTFLSYSFSNYWSCVDAVSQQRSETIKQKIKQYFDENISDEQLCKQQVLDSSEKVSIPEVRQLVRDFISIHRDHSFTGRAVARIFQGITSPCYPSEVWGRVHKFWRSYVNFDFNFLLKIANEEILKLR